MSDLYLHCYDVSPFTRKALCLLGIKRLEWKHVDTPLMPPKDDLVALTGGYRGTPVLQIGADVYIDSQRIALELERRHPRPTLFPGGDTGFAFLAVKWADTFFRAGLPIAIELTSADWPEPFRADRQYLFPEIDFDATRRGTAPARALFRWHAGQLDRQLADGRPFLGGEAPGLVDAQVYPFVWMARAYFPDVAAHLLDDFASLTDWERRMAQVGEGTRVPADADEAFAVARASTPLAAAGVDEGDPLGLTAGQQVEVSPDDTRRGAVAGTLVTLDRDEIAVAREHERTGSVVVHFPRLGYRVDPLR